MEQISLVPKPCVWGKNQKSQLVCGTCPSKWKTEDQMAERSSRRVWIKWVMETSFQVLLDLLKLIQTYFREPIQEPNHLKSLEAIVQAEGKTFGNEIKSASWNLWLFTSPNFLVKKSVSNSLKICWTFGKVVELASVWAIKKKLTIFYYPNS